MRRDLRWAGILVLLIILMVVPTIQFNTSHAAGTPQYGTAQSIVTGQSQPVGVTTDSAGNLYWVDWGSGQLLKLPTGGTTPVVLLSGLSSPQGVGIDSS